MTDYTNSTLATYTKISPNRTSPRNHALDTFTIHCFVGQVTAKRGCEVFQPKSKNASCNYVVGNDGSIGLCVEEKDRSWCSSNKANDMRAITFEVASETAHPYKVTDDALNALIDLMVDICKRNGKTKVLWFGDKSKTLAYQPKNNEMVMTVHRWFAAKSCPGDYLYGKHGYIAEEVNKKLNVEKENKIDTKKENPYPKPTRILYKKAILMKGDDVKWLQWELIRHGCLAEKNAKGKSNVDGILGNDTSNAIYTFQRKVGITADGKCGAITRSRLEM